ncbi:alpha/beta hydrolase [Trebonia kvetii]|uniref:Alpha/beta hydrolase n=1 Tax=Trebonia kvetii TaxID=2480626 RepID=A0A6P2CAY8_9ACTN|nr:alpha/beta hydrolase [Trebonia kvetii]TVZ06743.1 alpha/beta hydrolase [Trebonia kvetii]
MRGADAGTEGRVARGVARGVARRVERRVARQVVPRVVRRVEAGVGASEPAIVLEAGLGNAAAARGRVIPLLAPHVRVVAHDRAGLGGSTPAPGLVTIDRQVDDLAAIIAGLTAGPCVLAGHSWGGVLVQLLAFRRPELVAGLVLVDPGHEEMDSGLPLAFRWGWRIVRAVVPDELDDDAPVTLAAFAGAARLPEAVSRRARCRAERCSRVSPPIPRALDGSAGWARGGSPAGSPCRCRRHRP